MTHNQTRMDEWWKEGIAALVSGTVYGFTNAMAGSPMDVIKTKMQTLENYKSKNSFQSAYYVLKTYGIRGFFKGVTGPLFGSSVFRAVQFASYEAFYTKTKDDKYLTKKIPFTFGLELRVIFGGIVSGTCRSIIESPFEFTKVRRQTNQQWEIKNLYLGYRVTWLKATGLMTTYFVIIDSFRRNTRVFEYKSLLFFVNGFAATLGFIVIWPFEIVKNKVQMQNKVKYSIFGELRNNIRNDGALKAMFRGAGPGLSSVFIRNGAAMIAMQRCQKFLAENGYRQ